MFDWQVIVVACVLLLAGAYVGRRGWLRISSLAISKRNAPSCDKACGHCEGEGSVVPQFSPTSRFEEKSRHVKKSDCRHCDLSHSECGSFRSLLFHTRFSFSN